MEAGKNQTSKSEVTVSSFICMPIGTVIKAHVIHTNPPKTKRFIIVGYYEGNAIIVFFNSEINAIHNYSSELRALHIPFESNNKSYLRKNCYCDCARLYIENAQQLHDAVKTNPDIVLGQLEKEDLDKVINMLKSSPTIKGTHKKRYGFYNY
jgi:hypothetical protein